MTNFQSRPKKSAGNNQNKFRNNWFKFLREPYLFINIILMLFPLYFMILSSTKTNREFIAKPFAFPHDFPGTLLSNVKQVFSGKILLTGGFELDMFSPFLLMLKNTVVITFISLALLIIVSVMAGYAIGRKNFKGKNAFMVFILIIQAVPFFGYIVPMYKFMDILKLTDSLFGVTLVYVSVALPLSIILFQAYFKTFPKSIEEAALIDGCSEMEKFIYVVLPIAKGCIASLVLINFMGFWNEYAIANLLLTGSNLRTINIGVLMTNSQVGQQYYGYAFALLVLSALPNFIFFTIFQKNILQGISLGSVKG